MRPSGADPASSPFSTRFDPALTSFADEICAMVARLFAYVGTLALVAILAVHFWEQLPDISGSREAPRSDWSVADRSAPAFALSVLNPDEKSGTYTILRHPQGGRRDIFRWIGEADRPLAELEIYRFGGEAFSALPPLADLAARMPVGRADLEAAGVIESKFGPIALLARENVRDGAGACLGFFKTHDDAALRLSGWSCQGDGLPARRSAIACMLDRLTLLSAGNEPKLAELFARAELRRQGCGPAGATAASDWITEADNPHLRGAL
ncbi:hypothetical protein [Bradyrhizobium sp. STM 3562]|uniref:hypothetical protein n=1 Tax=Bradyrhizobium sp. STM 3562 TaxID=578924 RepID=UPI00388E0DBE